MKIKLLIATGDCDYAEHLSNVLAEKHGDTFEVSVCSSAERLRDLLAVNRFDVALLESEVVSFINLKVVSLPLILWDEMEQDKSEKEDLKKVRKYQRISSIVGNILEIYAEISAEIGNFGSAKANITVVWSPIGGTGKTTVALAYAAYQVSQGKQTTYLNLETFSSLPVYFQEKGKSISTVFEKLESNVSMHLKGIKQQDSGSGIAYFSGPTNYDDINILTKEDIEILINAGADGGEELVVDLSNQCDSRTHKIFEMADTILLVCDSTKTSQVKLRQFMNQHNIFGRLQTKCVLVNNKGSRNEETGIQKEICLPMLQMADPVSVYKTLSGSNFEW